MHAMNYKKPGITVDIIVCFDNSEIILIKRNKNPYKGYWALPGGYLEYGKETLEDAAIRELKEETGLRVIKDNLHLIGIYSDPNRDPRGHTISAVYFTSRVKGKLRSGDDAEGVKLFSLYKKLPKLAFDHKKMIENNPHLSIS